MGELVLPIKRLGTKDEEDHPSSASPSLGQNKSRRKRAKHLTSNGNDSDAVDRGAKKVVQFDNNATENSTTLSLHPNRTAFEREECWHTPQDYLNFMKERFDTVRVYQSVNGDMTFLQDHYTIRGLEHLVEMRSYIEMQTRQKRAIAAVIRAHRHKLSAEAIREASLEHSGASVRRALARAAGTVPTFHGEAQHRILSPSGIIYPSSSDHYQRAGSSPVSPSLRQSVDLRSLRAMNTQLLQQFQRQAPPRLVTPLTSADSTRRILLQRALRIPFPAIHEKRLS